MEGDAVDRILYVLMRVSSIVQIPNVIATPCYDIGATNTRKTISPVVGQARLKCRRNIITLDYRFYTFTSSFSRFEFSLHNLFFFFSLVRHVIFRKMSLVTVFNISRRFERFSIFLSRKIRAKGANNYCNVAVSTGTSVIALHKVEL